MSLFLFWSLLPRTGLSPHLSEYREVSLFPFQLSKQTSIIFLNLLKKLGAKAVLKTPPFIFWLKSNTTFYELFFCCAKRDLHSLRMEVAGVLPEDLPPTSYTHTGCSSQNHKLTVQSLSWKIFRRSIFPFRRSLLKHNLKS